MVIERKKNHIKTKELNNYIFIPFSKAALIALMFAAPLILYMYELDPKPPTQEIWNIKFKSARETIISLVKAIMTR